MPPTLVTAATLTDPARARPLPGVELRAEALGAHDERFVPAPELLAWMQAAFIEESSPLYNPEHKHLRFARIGVLWTNVANARQMRAIVGMAEMPMAKGGKWAKARHDLQLRTWFGSVPEFVITILAPYAYQVDDATFCALIEHEMLHCAQRRNVYGVPQFSRVTGRPIFAMRGHDVEQFTSIARRYGARAAGVEAMVAAASEPPLMTTAAIAGACGTCLARAA